MGHAFGIFLAHVGALRLRLRRRLPVALGFCDSVENQSIRIVKIWRSNAWLAVIVSATLHLLLVSYGSKMVQSRSVRVSPSTEPMVIRVVPKSESRQPIGQVATSPKNPQSPAKYPAPRQPTTPHTQEGELPASQPITSTAAISSPPERSASGPSTAAILERITDGVLRAAKSNEATMAQNKPWLAASQPERGSMPTEQTAQGGRVERIHSPLGTYCVNTPNPATAYRSATGINIAGVGNCP